MNQKLLFRLALLVLALFGAIAFVGAQIVTAQQAGDGGYGGAGGAGASGFGPGDTGTYDGSGGRGGVGGAGGGGGGGGILQPSTHSKLAAFGNYVYVLRRGQLYQYAAYDLALVKKVNVSDSAVKKRSDRRENGGRRGANGGAGGDGADGANGGQSGAGGFGGGFAVFATASSEGVAAAGDFVYVLQGDILHKLAADGLTSIKTKTLKFDE